MNEPLSLDQAKKLVDAYNESTLKAQKEITEHYRQARRYYANSLREVVAMVSPTEQMKLRNYVERNLLSWPVAGE